jgi:hypothetical protein
MGIPPSTGPPSLQNLHFYGGKATETHANIDFVLDNDHEVDVTP